MVEFLQALLPDPDTKPQQPLLLPFGPDSPEYGWVWNILSNLPEDDLFTGFSEYASYVSWVRQTYPSRQYILPRKTWLRHPLGGSWGMRWAQLSHWGAFCCPTAWQHWVMWALGYDYYGFEVGHHGFCSFRSTAEADGTYGLHP